MADRYPVVLVYPVTGRVPQLLPVGPVIVVGVHPTQCGPIVHVDLEILAEKTDLMTEFKVHYL